MQLCPRGRTCAAWGRSPAPGGGPENLGFSGNEGRVLGAAPRPVKRQMGGPGLPKSNFRDMLAPSKIIITKIKGEPMTNHLNRRLMLAGAAAAVPALAYAQDKPQFGTPLSVITNPQRDF